MPLVQIEDRDTIHRISGRVIGRAGTNSGKRKARWMQITLYRLDSGGLLLHRVSYSRVYHDNTGRCRDASNRVMGLPCSPADLPSDAEPCSLHNTHSPRVPCDPPEPDLLGPTETIKFEFPRHTFDECASADEVEAKLAQRDPSRSMSEPSRSVLDQARTNDAEFAARPKKVVQY